MKNKRVLLILFVLVAIIQVCIPAQMVYQSEFVVAEGATYKFKTEPIDPTDPFRGKYITLSFESDEVYTETSYEWASNDVVYVTIRSNAMGFTELLDAYKEIPEGINEDYIKATVIRKKSSYLQVKLPFDRFYMEESKAYEAELAYRDAFRSTKENTYAEVKVQDGKAVLMEVFIGKKPIKEVVEERLEREEIQTVK